MYEDIVYITFSMSEIDLVDFNQLSYVTPNAIRKSLDGSKGILKWKGEAPECINLLTTKSQFYSHQEMFEIVNTSEWSEPYVFED
jgi:hypothetical protein